MRLRHLGLTVVRLLTTSTKHNIGMYYFGDGQNPIPAVNVIDVYNFIRYGEPSDGRSSLIKQVKDISDSYRSSYSKP